MREIDSKEFNLLYAYSNLHTLDPHGWRQTSSLIYFIATMFGAKNIKPDDFIPVKKKKAAVMSIEGLAAKMMSFVRPENRGN